MTTTTTSASRGRSLIGRAVRVQIALATATAAMVIGVAVTNLEGILRVEQDWELGQFARRAARKLEPGLRAGRDGDRAWIEGVLADATIDETRMDLLDVDGRVMGTAPPVLAGRVQDSPAPVRPSAAGCASRDGWRACSVAIGDRVVVASQSLFPGDNALRHRTRDIVFFGILGVLLVAVLNTLFAWRALRPMSRMAERIAALAPGRGDRLGIRSGFHEIDGVAARFDALLASIDEALERERRFAAEASHELQTPLTVLRAEIETLARRGPAPEAARALRATDDLIALVEALLLLARAQRPFAAEDLEIVNLADVVRAVATAAGPRVVVDAPDEALVQGHERLLARATHNLIDNALKYSAANAVVSVGLATVDGKARLAVRDRGDGVPRESRERIFEPFIRGGPERARTPGHGLGLPLARSVARAHHGDLRLDASGPGGSTFVFELPLVR